MRCPHCYSEIPETSRFCSECGTRLKPSDTLKITPKKLKRGFLFAQRYQIIEELGSGGMGTVYRVLDTNVKEEVALKLLRPDIASDPKTIKRFRNEMKFTRQIPHRNVCKMYDLGESEGTAYITMEYVRGENLRSFIKRSGQLTISKAISLCKQVCEGLEEAHRLGVIHRDLKSGNIMIDKDGNAQIMDFGIARSMKIADDTGAGVLVGTPEYMSPEQVETNNVDRRADLYSLGIVLFEMLTGSVPFKGNTPVALALKHRRELPPSPRDINPDIPMALDRLVLKCLEKDKENRFQNASEIFNALKKIEKENATTERFVPGSEQTEKKRVNKPLAGKWGLVALLFALISIVAVGIQFFPTDSPALSDGVKMMVVLPFENLGPPEDDYFADGIAEEINSRLSSLKGLGIISRTSAKHFKESEKTARQIGDELGVDYVLEGTVQWDRGDDGSGRVRVTPRLIRVEDDMQLWSERYDRVLEDIFSVQADIAEQVARQLDLTLLTPEREALHTPPTADMEAYNLYLKAKEYEYGGWLSSNTRDFEQALDMYDKATSLDPDFALAFAEKSLIHSRLYSIGLDGTEDHLAEAKRAVDRAQELEPDLPETQIALAFYYYWGLLDYDRALEVFESVQKAHPNVTPELKGFILRRQGLWEDSLKTLQTAYQLNPRYSQLAYEIGLSYLANRQYDQAGVWFDRVLSINPDRLAPRLGKIAVSVCTTGEVREASTMLGALPDHPLTDVMRFTIHLFERDYRKALAVLDSLSYESFEAQHSLFLRELAYAQVYHATGDITRMRSHADAARRSLESSFQEHAQDPRYLGALGQTYAYLDRREDAIREANRAIALFPVQKDAVIGPICVFNLARIFAINGNHAPAIEHLDYLLSIPSYEFLWHIVSIPCLKLDPVWDVLHELPEFRRLLDQN